MSELRPSVENLYLGLAVAEHRHALGQTAHRGGDRQPRLPTVTACHDGPPRPSTHHR